MLPDFAVLIAALAAALCLLGVPPTEAGDLQILHYRGIRPDDPGGRDGLRNPERALRLEVHIAESSESDRAWAEKAQSLSHDGLTLAQTYCYLTEFVGKPISDEKLRLLQGSFDTLRASGLKAVLRFAYEPDTDRRGGPTLQDILAHIRQLKPIIRRNADVIFVMQAGFVGAWGEWHSSTHSLEGDHHALAQIVAAVLDALPQDRMTEVRVPKYKRWVLSDPLLGGFRELDAAAAHRGSLPARIGFNDDGFLAGPSDGGTWPEGPLFGAPGNPEYDYMTRESAWLPVDGELFWSDQAGKVDGLRAAIALRRHHYSSFSAIHSYSVGEGKPFSMDDWAKTPLTLDQVRAERLPVSGGYFEDAQGQIVPRTQFEYIRDHLGYRIELQRASFPSAMKPGSDVAVSIDLTNRGFSTLHNPRPVVLALIGPDGAVTEQPIPAADPRSWQPFAPGDPFFRPLTHRLTARLHVPALLRVGQYRLGLWLPDAAETLRLNPSYAIHVANADVPFWTSADGRYGINLLGSVAVQG
jgi:hypothetical protein